MREPTNSSTANEPRPFQFVGGDPSVDLVNTVDWTERGPTNERLPDYESLVQWAVGAGVVTAAQARRLRRLAASPAATRAWKRAMALRSVLQRLFHALAAGDRAIACWQEFDRFLIDTMPRLRLTPLPTRRGIKAAAAWTWPGAGDDPESLLWPVVRAAADLLASDEAHDIRVCGGSDCGWVFIDRSRNGLRRWCQMETCGTIAKSRRRRQRGDSGAPAAATAGRRSARSRRSRG